MKNFLTRSFTSVFILIIFGAIVASSFFNIVFELTIACLCAFCVFEAVNALGYAKFRFLALPTIYAFVVPQSFYFAELCNKNPYYFILIETLIFILLFNVVSMKNFSDVKFSDATSIIFSSIVITVFLSNIISLRTVDDNGLFYMIITIVCFAWATDIFAYLVGVLFGKHRFSPNISPKKSIEGSIGGTLFCIAATVGAVYIYSSIKQVEINLVLTVVYSFLCSLVGQIGDFSFSYIKRSHGIKDFGKILPGHGGVLDRLDSLIFISPFFYMLITFESFIG